MKTVKIGIIGFGTVGTGIYERITSTQRALQQMVSDRIELVSILVKDQSKHRQSEGAKLVTSSWDLFREAATYDVVFEVTNVVEPARTYTESLLAEGVSVVTANKKLVALHGKELEAVALSSGAYYGYDAAVCGAIPIVNVLQSVLATTAIEGVSGILNGTTNFILTEMDSGKTYQQALDEAQRLGYAETDPTSDVEGYDALYKLTLLARLCFGQWVDISAFERQGISGIEPWHIRVAKENQFALKLVGTSFLQQDGSITGTVKPAFVKETHLLAGVNGVANGVLLQGKDIQQLFFAGPGAGQEATANSAVEDFILHEKGNRLRRTVLSQPASNMPQLQKQLWFVPTGANVSDVSSNIHVWQRRREKEGDVLLVTAPHVEIPYQSYQVIGAEHVFKQEQAHAL